jgi:hypothetical protein
VVDHGCVGGGQERRPVPVRAAHDQPAPRQRREQPTKAGPVVVAPGPHVRVDGQQDQGESAFGLTTAKPGSCLNTNPATVFNMVSYPGEPKGDPDLYLKVARDGAYPGFDACLANGVPAGQAAILAATQRPVALGALTGPTGTPAWTTIPSWAVFGTADRAIPPAELLFMAHRAHAHVTEIKKPATCP